MNVPFKFPKGLASFIVAQREMRNTYNTNRAIKAYGFFAALKTITESGVVKDYNKQITAIADITKKSRAGVFNYISYCKLMGLLKVRSGNIYLSSWQKVVEAEDCPYSGMFTTLQYDTINPKQTPEYLIYAAEIKENQDRQTSAVIKQIENNLPLAQVLGVGQSVSVKHVEQLHNLQVFTFVNGKSENDYQLIHSVRADNNRTARTLRVAYGFKSRRSVKYLKVQLSLRGVATLSSRSLQSLVNNRVNKNIYYTGYKQEVDQTFWKMPDLIKLKVA